MGKLKSYPNCRLYKSAVRFSVYQIVNILSLTSIANICSNQHCLAIKIDIKLQFRQKYFKMIKLNLDENDEKPCISCQY